MTDLGKAAIDGCVSWGITILVSFSWSIQKKVYQVWKCLNWFVFEEDSSCPNEITVYADCFDRNKFSDEILNASVEL